MNYIWRAHHINPYSSQSWPNSNISTNISVCSSLWQGYISPSRSLFGAVQLFIGKCPLYYRNKHSTYALNYTCKHRLFRVIPNVRSKLYIAQQKWLSGHLTTSGVSIPGFKVSSILANEEWRNCWQNLRNMVSSWLVLLPKGIVS